MKRLALASAQPAALLLALLLLTTPGRGAEPARPPPQAAALEAARRFLCPHGGSPGRGGRCGPAGQGWLGQELSAVRGWDRGLPPPARLQAACPPGTQPEPALAAPGTLRCKPRTE